MGGKVKANDRDTGENSKSTYGIVEGDDQGVFEIITDTQTQEGILRLKKVSSSRNSSALLATLGVNYRPNHSKQMVENTEDGILQKVSLWELQLGLLQVKWAQIAFL